MDLSLSEDDYTSKAVLLSLTGEDMDNFEGLKQGNLAAICTAATQLQMDFRDGPLVIRHLHVFCMNCWT